MTALALVPQPSHKPVAAPVEDDLWWMLQAFHGGTDTQRAVALALADNNYLASRKDKK